MHRIYAATWLDRLWVLAKIHVGSATSTSHVCPCLLSPDDNIVGRKLPHSSVMALLPYPEVYLHRIMHAMDNCFTQQSGFKHSQFKVKMYIIYYNDEVWCIHICQTLDKIWWCNIFRILNHTVKQSFIKWNGSIPRQIHWCERHDWWWRRTCSVLVGKAPWWVRHAGWWQAGDAQRTGMHGWWCTGTCSG